MRTFRRAPRIPATAARAATPASEADAGLPVLAICSASGRAFKAVSMVCSGTCAAYKVAASRAWARASFSCSVFLGMARQSMMRLKEAVSSSMSLRSSFTSFWPSSATSENSFQRWSQPRLWADKLATIVARAAPKAPMAALTDPPPGAALSEAVSRTKPSSVICARPFTGSAIRYSITFSCGLKGFKSSKDMLLTAILTISCSLMPKERCCRSR